MDVFIDSFSRPTDRAKISDTRRSMTSGAHEHIDPDL
jgi:hypothetical protein